MKSKTTLTKTVSSLTTLTKNSSNTELKSGNTSNTSISTAPRKTIISKNPSNTFSTMLASIMYVGALAQDTFETISKNLKAKPFTLSYVGTILLAIEYALSPTESILKTFGYTGNQLTSITLSNDTPVGISLVKTFAYSGNQLVGVTYS